MKSILEEDEEFLIYIAPSMLRITQAQKREAFATWKIQDYAFYDRHMRIFTSLSNTTSMKKSYPYV